MVRAGWKARWQDATTGSRPGSTGTDARLQVEVDVANLCVTGGQITEAKVGESLAHGETAADEIRVADRGQALARGRGLVWRPGYLVVRLNWPNLPLLTPTGDRLALIAWLTTRDHPAAIPGQLDPPPGRFPVRWQHPPPGLLLRSAPSVSGA